MNTFIQVLRGRDGPSLHVLISSFWWLGCFNQIKAAQQSEKYPTLSEGGGDHADDGRE